MYKRVVADSADDRNPLEEGHDAQSSGLQRKTATVVKEGLLIEVQQLRIRRLVAKQDRAMLKALDDEITNRRAKIETRIRKLRLSQATVFPSILPWVQRQGVKVPEHESLFLPSDFEATLRITLGLAAAAGQEILMREGDAYDCIRAVKRQTRMLSAMQLRKQKDSRGQKLNTRSNLMIGDVVFERNLSMERYNHNRYRLIKLQALAKDDPAFPMLTNQDLEHRPTEAQQVLNESKRADGKLWTVLGKLSGKENRDHEAAICVEVPESEIQSSDDEALNPGTSMTKRVSSGYKRRKVSHDAEPAVTEAQPPTSTVQPDDTACVPAVPRTDVTREGWIWNVGKAGKMTAEELNEWEEEGDRVQFFRAEGELYRWIEQYETKHAEFERSIKAFQSTSRAWLDIAKDGSGNAGSSSYAYRQASIYAQLATNAAALYHQCGERSIVGRQSSVPVHEAVEVFRRQTFQGLPQMLYDNIVLIWDTAGKTPA